jgi:hypothetical protein
VWGGGGDWGGGGAGGGGGGQLLLVLVGLGAQLLVVLHTAAGGTQAHVASETWALALALHPTKHKQLSHTPFTPWLWLLDFEQSFTCKLPTGSELAIYMGR